MLLLLAGLSLSGTSPMDCGHLAESSEELSSPGAEPDSLLPSSGGSNSCLPLAAGPRAGAAPGRPAAANAARERSRVQTLRHAFLELQRTLPSVPPDTKLSKLDVLLLATTYIAHLTRSLQDEEESPGEGLGTLRADGYLHPVKVGELRSSYHLLSPLDAAVRGLCGEVTLPHSRDPAVAGRALVLLPGQPSADCVLITSHVLIISM
uniref:Transcription factor 24 n=1 Tax=Cyanoderma ruficeps TaxID=181631 RepID=A0A8C3QQK8_9PASS